MKFFKKRELEMAVSKEDLAMRREEDVRSALAMLSTGSSIMLAHEALSNEEQAMLRMIRDWAKKEVVSERFTPHLKKLIDELE